MFSLLTRLTIEGTLGVAPSIQSRLARAHLGVDGSAYLSMGLNKVSTRVDDSG